MAALGLGFGAPPAIPPPGLAWIQAQHLQKVANPEEDLMENTKYFIHDKMNRKEHKQAFHFGRYDDE